MEMSAELLAQIFRLNCAVGGVIGSGTYHCPFNISRIATLVFTPSGQEFEEEMSLAYLQQLQQEGKAVVLSKSTSTERRTAADNINTEPGSNIKTIAGKSPREFGFIFKNGLYFDKAIRTLETFGSYDVTYIDVDLSIIFTSTATTAKGFACGQIGVEPYMEGNGADDAKSILWLQELYISEFNVDATWITQPYHDIRLASLDGVNQMTINFETIPSGGDTTIVFSLKNASAQKVDMGLLATNLQLIKNGSPVTISSSPAPSYSPTTGNVTATLPSALAEDDNVSLRLNDSAFTTGIIKKGGRLFVSNTDTVITLQGIPVITSSGTTQMNQGVVDSYAILATGADSYGVTGTLPTGLTVNSVTGQIIGTPTNFGTFNVNVTATNEVGTSTMPLVITVTEFTTITPVAPNTAINVTDTTLTLIFTQVSTKTRVYQGASTLLGTVNGGNSFDVTGLTADTVYTFKIKGENESGALTNYSPTLSVTTLP